MSNQANSLKKGLTVKDLVTTGIFSAIFFVFTLIGGLPFAPNPVLTFYMPMGAALLCADGTVYQGCNIENASYSPTVCAERTAFFKAVYDGHRDFAAIAVCGGKDGVITGAFPPCGVCRQVMREFCGDDFLIYMITPEGCEAHTLAEILPFSFSAQKHMHT